MLHPSAPRQPPRASSWVAVTPAAVLALPLAAAGVVLAGGALGLGPPLVDVAIRPHWARALSLATGAMPLQAFQVTHGVGYFVALVVLALLALAFLSVTGSLLGFGSLDPSAAQWIVPGRTLAKLEAGAGLRGLATIDDVHETGWMVNDQPQVQLELTVSVAGREAYATRVTDTVPLLALGRLVRGGVLPVLVDADAPEHLVVLWKDL